MDCGTSQASVVSFRSEPPVLQATKSKGTTHEKRDPKELQHVQGAKVTHSSSRNTTLHPEADSGSSRTVRPQSSGGGGRRQKGQHRKKEQEAQTPGGAGHGCHQRLAYHKHRNPPLASASHGRARSFILPGAAPAHATTATAQRPAAALQQKGTRGCRGSQARLRPAMRAQFGTQSPRHGVALPSAPAPAPPGSARAGPTFPSDVLRSVASFLPHVTVPVRFSWGFVASFLFWRL